MSARRSRRSSPTSPPATTSSYLPPALKAQGADVIAQIAIPPTESSFTKYFPQIPADTEVLYHVMVGPAVLTFVKELGEFYGTNRPQLFGFMDSLEAVDINSPGLEFLDGSHFWEGSPRATRRPTILRLRRPIAPRSASTAICARQQATPGRRIHGRPYVRLLGDALRHQEGDGEVPATRGRRIAPSWSRRLRR